MARYLTENPPNERMEVVVNLYAMGWLRGVRGGKGDHDLRII
jgi:hypothetical protein